MRLYLDLVKIKTPSFMSELNSLKPGQIGIIDTFLDEETACKMISMGICPGCQVKVIRKAPFGGAIYIKADHQQFAIRNQEAECVVLK